MKFSLDFWRIEKNNGSKITGLEFFFIIVEKHRYSSLLHIL